MILSLPVKLNKLSADERAENVREGRREEKLFARNICAPGGYVSSCLGFCGGKRNGNGGGVSAPLLQGFFGSILML